MEQYKVQLFQLKGMLSAEITVQWQKNKKQKQKPGENCDFQLLSQAFDA